MTRKLKLALAAAIATGLGAIAGTIWVGASVREETVVARPYEDGLRHDAERRARESLGLSVRRLDEAPEAGAGPVAFEIAGRDGRGVEGVEVRVEATRPGTSRGEVAAAARALGGGRFEAPVALPEPGPWDLRFDVTRGADRVRLERRVVASVPCDLRDGPCTRPLPGGGALELELSPRPLRTMRELAVRASVRGLEGEPAVEVSFAMDGMEMGRNAVALARAGAGWAGAAVLVRCPSGRRDWTATAAVARPGEPPRTVRFRLTVAE